MKIKEVSAGVKISKNYNSYQMNLVADVENGEEMKKKNIRECFGIKRNKYKEVKSNLLDLSL